MLDKLSQLLDDVARSMNDRHCAFDLSVFFKLLFNTGEKVQIKLHSFAHPADADYIELSGNNENHSEWLDQYSETGIQLCANAVPLKFSEKLSYLHEIISLSQPQWDRLVPSLRDDLSLNAALFENGRTFFIEADTLPNGEDIRTNDDKLFALKELLKSGLPISYILDTGGRGPHIGIVLKDAVSKDEFDRIVRQVMQRQPTWIDSGVGRINQMERLPGTLRLNKLSEVVPVRLLYIGQRVDNKELSQWIDASPILNPDVVQKPTLNEREWETSVDLDEAEAAAWRFIADHGLKSAKRASRRGVIAVSCPNATNHKSGKDRNMSAFINIKTGLVHCSACQKMVARTFKSQFIQKAKYSPLIDSCEDEIDLASIKPAKIF